MSLPSPARPMSILIVSQSLAEGNLLTIGLQESLDGFIKIADTTNDLEKGVNLFVKAHHDLVLLHGWSTARSEAFLMRIRQHDGSRHTGVIVMCSANEGFDRVVVDHYNAGADEVVPLNLSLAILRTKIIMVFNFKVTTDMLRAANHKLQNMAVTDELTGCSNMRGFARKFSKVMNMCTAGETGVAIIMMDLDHFKKVNDTHNHLVGSHVIRATGQLLLNSQILEGEDFAARYGGDEFIILLAGDSPSVQLAKASRIRELIASNVFAFDGVTVRITASLGVGWAPKGFHGQNSDLVKAADAMLYRSKDLGRNQVNAMVMKYPVDFSKIGSQHLIEMPGVGAKIKKAN